MILNFNKRYQELINPLLDEYGVAHIKYNTTGAFIYDTLDPTIIGTIYNNPTRVPNWNDTDIAMNFNGSNQYVHFNKSVFPYKEKTVRCRFKYTRTANPTVENRIFATTTGTMTGMVLDIMPNHSLRFLVFNSSTLLVNAFYYPTSMAEYREKFNLFHVSIDENRVVKAYFNDKLFYEAVLPVNYDTTLNQSILTTGASALGNTQYGGIIDSIEVYNKGLPPHLFDLNYSLMENEGIYYSYTDRVPSATSSNEDIGNYRLQYNTIELADLKGLEEYYE